MEIRQIVDDKLNYMNLLLEADPDEDIVKKYLADGDMYVLFENDIPAAEIVIINVNEEECELKNIATLKSARGKGYARKLINHVFEIYSKKGYKKMIVGTTENMIPFYVLSGFDRYHHTVKNFFVDNYKEPIFDGTLQCIDMYYYAKNLGN